MSCFTELHFFLCVLHMIFFSSSVKKNIGEICPLLVSSNSQHWKNVNAHVGGGCVLYFKNYSLKLLFMNSE